MTHRFLKGRGPQSYEATPCPVINLNLNLIVFFLTTSGLAQLKIYPTTQRSTDNFLLDYRSTLPLIVCRRGHLWFLGCTQPH